MSEGQRESDELDWTVVTVDKCFKRGVNRANKVETKPTLPFDSDNYYQQLDSKLDTSTPPAEVTDEIEMNEIPSVQDVRADKRRNKELKQLRRLRERMAKKKLTEEEDKFWEQSITRAEDERTSLAKNNNQCRYQQQIAQSSCTIKSNPSILKRGRNICYRAASKMRNLIRRATGGSGVRFDLSQNETFVIGSNTTDTKAKAKNIIERAFGAVHYLLGPTALADSGADNHYITEDDRQQANMPIIGTSTKQVGVANGGISEGRHVTKLPFELLSAKARLADTFDDFKHSLLSIGLIADDDNIALFSKDDVKIYRETDVLITCKGEPILIGVRDEKGRYRIPLVQQRHGTWAPRTPSKRARQALESANSVYDLPSIEEAIRWMHACLGYPVKSTWIAAVKNNHFRGWPLLTPRNVKKYYPETTETDKGHLNQTRKNVRSTKSKPMIIYEHADKLRGKQKRDVYVKLYDVRETIYSDQTGKFPKTSQSGNKYIMVMVEVDSNAILVEPMKSRSDDEMKRAYRHLLKRLKRAGVEPKKHVMDNEVSESMKDMIRDEFKMTLELVPPGMHRRNAAEVAIRNFKAHFLSILAGTAEDFPLSLWDRLLPQAELTLNLLRTSNANPNLSAYAFLCGPFDYNRMPLAPMGCRVQIHEKADQRGTWAYHTIDGWYLRTSDEHYRTHICHARETRSDRLSDTVSFQHKSITNPTLSHADKLMNAISHCSKVFEGKSNIDNETALIELERLMTATQTAIDKNELQPIREQVPRVETAPYIEPVRLQENQRITRSIANRLDIEAGAQPTTIAPTQPVPRVETIAIAPTQPAPRVETPATPPTSILKHNSPADNTRSRTKQEGPVASRTRAQAKRAITEIASAAAVRAGQRTPRQRKILSRMCDKIEKLEREVEEALAVLDQDTGKILNYRALLRHPLFKKDWSTSAANEFGRLAQGIGGRVKATDTIKFIQKRDVPADRLRDVTYGQFVCTIRPEKKEKNRSRLVVGGDRINYNGAVATPTAEMLVAKILFNSTISTPGAKFMTMDISNFYLNTPLTRPEYIRMKLSDIPDEIIRAYNLRAKATPDGSVYIEINKGMYGLPQAGLLANELLEKRLNKQGYYQSKLVPGLWKHKTRDIQFTLVVDDFGVKYTRREDAEHLLKTIEQHYPVTTDWTGTRYIGITLDWDYENRQVHLSLPGYVKKALLQFNHTKPTKRQDSPFPYTPPNYGQKKQYAQQHSDAPALDKKGKLFIQQVCGKFLFYGRAVDSTLLTPISAIASQQANPTEDTMAQTKQLLDYLASQDEAVLTYSASDMTLAVHSDAGYLNEPKARSRAGGHFYLSNNVDIPPNNGAILNIAHIIKHVMSSATEAELAALYIMAREAVYVRIILAEMGHKQPPTPIQTDNAMAEAVINGKIQPKRTKAMDMRFHWLRDRESQEQFRFHWRPGKLNFADYWTKHHSSKHHRHVRREFLTPQVVLEMFRQRQTMERQAGDHCSAPTRV